MKHLLRGIAAEDLEQLNKFLLANGITENAAASPLLTAEMSLTEGGSPAFDTIRLVFLFLGNRCEILSVPNRYSSLWLDLFGAISRLTRIDAFTVSPSLPF